MDINFNSSYGDIDLSGGDIKVANNEQMWIDSILRVIKTNHQDYPLNPYYGANIDSYIGESITDVLAEEMKSSLEYLLKAEGLPSGTRVLYLIRKHENEIQFRVSVPGMQAFHLTFINNKGFRVE